eukprot:3215682-Rhodomonas_salina.2
MRGREHAWLSRELHAGRCAGARVGCRVELEGVVVVLRGVGGVEERSRNGVELGGGGGCSTRRAAEKPARTQVLAFQALPGPASASDSGIRWTTTMASRTPACETREVGKVRARLSKSHAQQDERRA